MVLDPQHADAAADVDDPGSLWERIAASEVIKIFTVPFLVVGGLFALGWLVQLEANLPALVWAIAAPLVILGPSFVVVRLFRAAARRRARALRHEAMAPERALEESAAVSTGSSVAVPIDIGRKP